MKIRKFCIGFVVLFAISFPVMADEIVVAAAANLQFTLEEIKVAFEKETGIQLKAVIGSSGKLTIQIQNGAPFDVFMSADLDYPERLHKDGLTTDEPRIYAYGSLVLWTLRDIKISADLNILKDQSFSKVAIASPKTAPYGLQAVNAMKYYHLYPAIESKLVYGENIAQVNQFVTIEAVEAGFTAKSVVMASNMKVKGQWIDVNPNAYEPIAQAAVILKQSKSLPAAQKFYSFLFTPQAQEIFKKYGYTLPVS